MQNEIIELRQSIKNLELEKLTLMNEKNANLKKISELLVDIENYQKQTDALTNTIACNITQSKLDTQRYITNEEKLKDYMQQVECYETDITNLKSTIIERNTEFQKQCMKCVIFTKTDE